MKKKILLYEDNDALRSTLTTILNMSNDFTVVYSFFNPSGIIEDIRAHTVDVILMDINMPIMNGIEALKTIRSRSIHTPAIILTVFDDDDNIFDAICAGANGYLLKSEIDRVLNALQDVLQGGAPLTSSIAKKILANVKSPFARKQKDAENNLTAKEIEILETLAKGNSYKMISNTLSISIDTVRTHIKSIYKKLHVNSAVEAINKMKT
ncbi:MAG: response regulator transcription factor [Saprospiraceae bacterium]